MKYFGRVRSFDEATGCGLISPDTGGEDLAFDQTSVWRRPAPSLAGQRLSYDLKHEAGRPSATNLELI